MTSETIFTCHIQPETAQRIDSVLSRMARVSELSDYERGALIADAIFARSYLQADQKVAAQFMEKQ